MGITRRRLLSGAALAGVGAITGCGTLSQQQAAQLQSLITGAQSIETSLATNVPLLLGVVHLSAGDVANVRTALVALVQATNALAQVPTLAAGVQYVQAIETALNTIVTVAAGIPVIPEPYHTALVVAALALPPLEVLVGMAVQQGTALYDTIQAKMITKGQAVSPGITPGAGSAS